MPAERVWAADLALRAARRAPAQYLRFVLVSGTGLCLALVLLWLGVHVARLPVAVANAIGDAVAVSFVFFISERGIFASRGQHLSLKYGAWLAWQLVHIAAVSMVLQWLVRHFGAALPSPLDQGPETALKLLLTPVTLSLNFVAARLLLHRPDEIRSVDKTLPEPIGGAARILVFIPVYNCERQIPRVLAQFEDDSIAAHFDEVLVVDNGSRDHTVNAACAAAQRITQVRVSVARNRDNYGLGGSHKSAFGHALRHGFTHVVVLHGDDQADIRDLLPVLASNRHWQYDCCLGSRFMQGARCSGYSRFRVFGNRVFNILYSIAGRRRVQDLGSGLNIYRTEFLRRDFYRRYHDGLHFNCFLLLGSIAHRARLMFFPISWREEDQVSNVRLFRQAFQTLQLAARSVLQGHRFLAAEHRDQIHPDYAFDVLHDNAAIRLNALVAESTP